ncbi:MAG: hypothetical protein ACOH2A_13335 [Sphingobacteriaceae bacterium]
MKNLFLSALLFIGLVSIQKSAQAQDYNTAIGLKFGGYENGLSIKHFTSKDVALEGILGFRQKGIVITGLWEKHQTAFNLADLKFYYGFGAHIGSVGRYKRFNGDNETYGVNKLLLGADGILGLEYVIPNAPIGISLDLNPRVELASGTFFDLAPGLGLKYTF